MAIKLVNIVEVKNISGQIVILNVKALSGSTFFRPLGGNVTLKENVSITAEESRFDKTQLNQLRRKGVLTVNSSRRSVTATQI